MPEHPLLHATDSMWHDDFRARLKCLSQASSLKPQAFVLKRLFQRHGVAAAFLSPHRIAELTVPLSPIPIVRSLPCR
jgi:hypothetical protein